MSVSEVIFYALPQYNEEAQSIRKFAMRTFE